MRTKTETIIKLSLILAVMVLIAGCIPIKGIPTGKKCDLDSDCGGDYCSDNLQKVVSSTCVVGRCEDVSTECNESEICVADSGGVRCLPKDPDTNKAILSCGNNTIIPGLIPFNPAGYICRDDCPEDAFCNNDCICEKKEKLSCSENTEDFDNFGLSLFDQNTNMCADDCPLGFDCIVGCVCEEYVCPDPVFTTNYWGNAPPVDTHFDDLMDYWLKDPESLFDDLDIGDTINITAFDHYNYSGEVSHFIPFPEVQLTLVPNPDNEYIHEDGWEGYCVNDYYDGDEALDIDYIWLTRPVQTCIWGGTEGYDGVLTVCREHLFDWFEAYTE